MTSEEDFLSKCHLERVELFTTQDIENGFFDVVFDVEERQIYAHKIFVAPFSLPLKKMFNESTQTSFKIDFLYKDFFQFLLFLYSGGCDLKEENIVGMVQIASKYDVQDLIKECDEFLFSIQLNPAKAFNLFEQIYPFCLQNFENAICEFIVNDLSVFGSEEFKKLERDTVVHLISYFIELHAFSEELFIAVYQWAENRVLKTQNSPNKRKWDFNDAIKDELMDILPHFEFADMDRKFLDETVGVNIKYRTLCKLTFSVRKGFLFSYDELSDILSSAKKSRVEVINEEGHKMYGRIFNDHIVINAIKSTRDSDTELSLRDPAYEGCFWRTRIHGKPKSATILMINKDVDYYLLINSEGDLCIKARQEIDEDEYLLAEMMTFNDFIFNDCKIDII